MQKKSFFLHIFPSFFEILPIFWYLAPMYKFLTGRLMPLRIVLMAASLMLITIGIATIYAIGNPAQTAANSDISPFAAFWKKQLLFAAIGIAAFIAVNLINYRRLGTASYWLYAATILTLTVLLLDKIIDLPFVPVINNTRRWLRIGTSSKFIQIQPSELCKIAYILALAWYLRYRSNYRKFSGLIGPFVLTLIPMGLILLEPDLGTVLLMMPVLFVMLFVAGAKVKHLLIILLLTLLVSPFFWIFMKDYQKTRISSVLLQNPWIQKKAEQHPNFAKILVGKNFSSKQWKNEWGYT